MTTTKITTLNAMSASSSSSSSGSNQSEEKTSDREQVPPCLCDNLGRQRYGEILIDPVTTQTGFVCERSSIEAWWKTGGEPKCPMTRVVISRELRQNFTIQNFIRFAKAYRESDAKVSECFVTALKDTSANLDRVLLGEKMAGPIWLLPICPVTGTNYSEGKIGEHPKISPEGDTFSLGAIPGIIKFGFNPLRGTKLNSSDLWEDIYTRLVFKNLPQGLQTLITEGVQKHREEICVLREKLDNIKYKISLPKFLEGKYAAEKYASLWRLLKFDAFLLIAATTGTLFLHSNWFLDFANGMSKSRASCLKTDEYCDIYVSYMLENNRDDLWDEIDNEYITKSVIRKVQAADARMLQFLHSSNPNTVASHSAVEKKILQAVIANDDIGCYKQLVKNSAFDRWKYKMFLGIVKADAIQIAHEVVGQGKEYLSRLKAIVQDVSSQALKSVKSTAMLQIILKTVIPTAQELLAETKARIETIFTAHDSAYAADKAIVNMLLQRIAASSSAEQMAASIDIYAYRNHAKFPEMLASLLNAGFIVTTPTQREAYSESMLLQAIDFMQQLPLWRDPLGKPLLRSVSTTFLANYADAHGYKQLAAKLAKENVNEANARAKDNGLLTSGIRRQPLTPLQQEILKSHLELQLQLAKAQLAIGELNADEYAEGFQDQLDAARKLLETTKVKMHQLSKDEAPTQEVKDLISRAEGRIKTAETIRQNIHAAIQKARALNPNVKGEIVKINPVTHEVQVTAATIEEVKTRVAEQKKQAIAMTFSSIFDAYAPLTLPKSSNDSLPLSGTTPALQIRP